jgi:hypothetical protein
MVFIISIFFSDIHVTQSKCAGWLLQKTHRELKEWREPSMQELYTEYRDSPQTCIREREREEYGRLLSAADYASFP